MDTAPKLMGYPLIGVVPYMIKHGADYLKSAFHEHGDVVELKLVGPLRMFLIAHPDGVEQVLVKHHRKYLVKRPSMHLEAMMGNGLTLSNGDLWLRQRRMMQPAFHRQKIEAMHQASVIQIQAMLQRWNASSASIDLATEMERLSLSILLSTLFGAEISEADTKRIVDAVQFVLAIAGRGMFLEVPPMIPTPENLKAKAALRDLNRVIQELIDQRRRNPSSERNDLLSLLLDVRDESDNVMSEQQLRDEITAVLVAGYETTAVAMTWMFYLISQHPEVESKLLDELSTKLGRRVPSLDELAALDYMNIVISEALRVYPPFWAYTRQVVEDDEINGFRIPKGAMAVVSPYVTQKHPLFWENPEQFDPERFTKENAAGRHRFAYFPFGAGPRICIGERQAMLTLQLTLPMLMQFCSLRLVPEHTVAIHTAMTIRPKYGMMMSVEPRLQ
jgi:cytochrome P450